MNFARVVELQGQPQICNRDKVLLSLWLLSILSGFLSWIHFRLGRVCRMFYMLGFLPDVGLLLSIN